MKSKISLFTGFSSQDSVSSALLRTEKRELKTGDKGAFQMSEEQLKHDNHEQEHSDFELESNDKEILDNLAEKGQESAKAHAEKVKETLEDIREEAKAEASTTEELASKEAESTKQPEDTTLFVNSDLKNLKYKRTLQSVRKDLKPTERVLSRAIHNQAVDVVSEAVGKTIARPSGLLVGSIFAFVGSSVFLWISKHYGYEYNFLMFAMFFAAGFVIGLMVEMGLRLATRKSSKH